MDRSLALFGLLACAACGGAQSPRGAAHEGSLVLLRPNTVLRTAPQQDAPSLRLSSKTSLQDALVYRRVERHGAWLGVQPEVSDGHGRSSHCGDFAESLEPFAVTFWVPVEALVPVLVAPFEQHFDDDTSVVLRVGTPLEPGRNGRYNYTHDAWTFAFDVPSGLVGNSFNPSAPLEAFHGTETFVRDNEALRYQNDRVAGESTTNTPVAEQILRDMTREGTHNSEALLGLHTRCARVVVRVPDNALRNGGLGALMGGLGLSGRENLTLRAGATLFWPDGSHAGTLRTVLHVRPNTRTATSSQSDLVCFRHRVSYHDWGAAQSSEQILNFCIKPEDLQS